LALADSDAELRELTRENVNFRTIFLAVGTGLVGLVLIGVSEALRVEGFPEWTSKLIEVLGIAVFTIGVTGIAYELALRRHVAKEVIAAVNVRTSWLKSGMVENARYLEIGWRDFYTNNPGDIEIVTTYGSRHVKDMASSLSELAFRKGHDVRILMVDPDDPVLIDAYARLFDTMSADAIRNEILATAERWVTAGQRAARTATSSAYITVEFVKTLLPVTFYRAGDNMWVVFNSGQHQFTDFLPAFRCRPAGPDGVFEWAVGEVEAWRAQGLIRTYETVSRPVAGSWFRRALDWFAARNNRQRQ
ncbi:MAG TPA: hypothetical protein VGR71_01460, partial [Nitrospira sp.]|nr:hypothetical protein [Nitrospira sp.]